MVSVVETVGRAEEAAMTNAMPTASDPFSGNAAWCTKAPWPQWHFYVHSAAVPLCGGLFGLLETDEEVLVSKCHPDFATCDQCCSQGVRAGLWK